MRIPILDGYRAASIIFVLCGHLLPLGPKSWELNEAVSALGMTMFFSLSGFLIASQLLHDDRVSVFLTRRGARILPLAFVYTAFAFLVLSYKPLNLLFSDLFAINYLRPFRDDHNRHLWSLCVEVHFYLAIALVVSLAGRRAVWLVWPACVAITTIRIFVGAKFSIETHLRVDEILAGACLATAYGTWSNWRRVPWIAPATAILLVLFASSPLVPALPYLRPYLTAVLFVAVVNVNNAALRAIMTSATARYIADVSYALYVIHPATTMGWLAGTGTFDKYAIKRPISLAITFALAHLSTFYLERPFQNLARHASFKKRTA